MKAVPSMPGWVVSNRRAQSSQLLVGWLSGASQNVPAEFLIGLLISFHALQVLLDLCNQKGFIRTVYANLDCRVERSDLFENVCALLSKTAFPVNSPLGSVHLHSLEGLFSILAALSRGCVVAAVMLALFRRDQCTPYPCQCQGLPKKVRENLQVVGDFHCADKLCRPGRNRQCSAVLEPVHQVTR